jgi:hypothetical protein
MISTYFPNQTTLKARLKKRYPAQPLAPEMAKQVVTDASAASWSGDAEIKQRKRDIQRALQYLESNADSEVAYLRVAVDLQISKASALRTYCSILVAVALYSTQLSRGNYSYVLLLCVIALALVASLLTISTSWTSWPKENYFDTAEQESDGLVLLLVRRGCCVNLAVICSILATLAWGFAFTPIAESQFKANAEADRRATDAAKQEDKSPATQTPPLAEPRASGQSDVKRPPK